MQVDIAYTFVAFLAGLIVAFAVSGWVGWRWMHPKQPKVVVVHEPVTAIQHASTKSDAA